MALQPIGITGSRFNRHSLRLDTLEFSYASRVGPAWEFGGKQSLLSGLGAQRPGPRAAMGRTVIWLSGRQIAGQGPVLLAGCVLLPSPGDGAVGACSGDPQGLGSVHARPGNLPQGQSSAGTLDKVYLNLLDGMRLEAGSRRL